MRASFLNITFSFFVSLLASESIGLLKQIEMIAKNTIIVRSSLHFIMVIIRTVVDKIIQCFADSK